MNATKTKPTPYRVLPETADTLLDEVFARWRDAELKHLRAAGDTAGEVYLRLELEQLRRRLAVAIWGEELRDEMDGWQLSGSVLSGLLLFVVGLLVGAAGRAEACREAYAEGWGNGWKAGARTVGNHRVWTRTAALHARAVGQERG